MSDAMPDGFGRLARVYEGLERLVYGRLLERARLAFIDSLTPCRRILVLGEGDGRFLLAILKRHASCRVTVLERSPGMVRCAQARLAKQHPEAHQRVSFHVQDALKSAPSAEPYDAVITHFFLDLFGLVQLPQLITRLAEQLRPGGLWLLSDFARPSLVEGAANRLGSRLLLPLMYAFFRLTTGLSTRTLVAPQPYLHASGMGLEKSRRFRGGFIYAELWRKR